MSLRLITKALCFLFDARCFLCGRPWLEPSLCPSCPLTPHSSHYPSDWVYSSLILDEKGRHLLHLIKYESRLELSRLFLPYLPKTLPGELEDLFLVPVPMAAEKFFLRGFNQSEWLARAISKKTGNLLEASGLIKVRDTVPQSTLDRTQRSLNLEDAFAWDTRIPVPKRICLIDDVLTTGETLKACKKALEQVGVDQIVAWTLFRKLD